MSSQKRGATLIGSKFTARESTTANAQAIPPHLPLCKSKICTVKAPHLAKAYISTSKGLPKIVRDMEAKTEKNGYEIRFLDIFYTIHWDHVNRPLLTPTKECVHKACPVWARHEAKVFSKNPKKANLLPLKVQEVQAKPAKTHDEIQGLINFWYLHGPRETSTNGSST